MPVNIIFPTILWLNLRLLFNPKFISLFTSVLENLKDIDSISPKYRRLIRWIPNSSIRNYYSRYDNRLLSPLGDT